MHIQALGYAATAAAAGGSAAAAVAGDSLTIQNAVPGSKILILAQCVRNQTAGFHQIIYPSGHDTTRGWRTRVQAALAANQIPFGYPLRVQSQELLAITISAGAVAGDIENGNLLVWYENVPGISANLVDNATLNQRVVRMTTVEATITTGAGGGYTGAEAINAESDLLHANTDYAILGALFQATGCVLGIRAPDFGNVRIPILCDPTNPALTVSWFSDLSYNYGMPLIPVFNSANRANVLIDAQTDENAVALPFALILAELSMA